MWLSQKGTWKRGNWSKQVDVMLCAMSSWARYRSALHASSKLRACGLY